MNCKLRKLAERCFVGELTVPKAILWLAGINCVLAGIVYGLCIAPLTHGVTIGCNNGNSDIYSWDEDEQEEEEV